MHLENMAGSYTKKDFGPEEQALLKENGTGKVLIQGRFCIFILSLFFLIVLIPLFCVLKKYRTNKNLRILGLKKKYASIKNALIMLYIQGFKHYKQKPHEPKVGNLLFHR